MAKIITVSKNNSVIVDDEDFEFLNRYRWYQSRGGYVIFGEARDGIKAFCKMHRLIMKAPAGSFVDHVDRNKNNNQKANLRIVDVYANAHNHPKKRGGNKYIGVNFVTRLNAYQSRCRVNGNDIFLGYYKDEVAAAAAYNFKASELSKFATLNPLPVDDIEAKKLINMTRLAQKVSPKQSKYKFIFFKPKSVSGRGGDTWYVRVAKNAIKFGFKSEEQALEYIKCTFLHLLPDNFDFLK